MASVVNVGPLQLIKSVHTLVWGIFAGAIIVIPVAAWLGAWRAVAVLTVLVLAECLVLAFNRMRCPLTAIAARYTADRRANFDIYLPLWLAQYNKHIFGTLFVAGLVITAFLWYTR